MWTAIVFAACATLLWMLCEVITYIVETARRISDNATALREALTAIENARPRSSQTNDAKLGGISIPPKNDTPLNQLEAYSEEQD